MKHDPAGDVLATTAALWLSGAAAPRAHVRRGAAAAAAPLWPVRLRGIGDLPDRPGDAGDRPCKAAAESLPAGSTG